jgi:hypothetical protein
MPLTDFQRRVCRIVAHTRIAAGDSYVPGGAALNELIGAARHTPVPIPARRHGDVGVVKEIDVAREVAVLPAEAAGMAVLTTGGDLFTGDATLAAETLGRGALLFHPGRIGGALPRFIR